MDRIVPIISNLIFFAEEKWKIARDKPGSGNTRNIGSVTKIEDLLSSNGMFSRASEEIFDDYWINYGKLEIMIEGKKKILNSFKDYHLYRKLPLNLYNPIAR